MTAIDTMLQERLAQAIGWALLQFLWQGALIGLVTAGVLAALRRSAADVRYVIATIALSVMFTIPVVSAVQMILTDPVGLESTAVVTAAAVQGSDPAPARVAGPVSGRVAAAGESEIAARFDIEPWLPLLVNLWFAGVAVLTLRLLSGWVWVQRMRTHGAVPAGGSIDGLAQSLVRRLHIGRPVRLLESALVEVPTVIGWLKPVVLLPASALAGLSPGQLEAVLAHELAHVRRHDYLVNLLQTLVETLLFYHPAVWWVSRRIRVERENCCDDLAVSLCGDPVAYAAALTELEGLRTVAGRLAMAANGGSLLQRVRRLLGAPSHAGRAPGWLAAGVAVVVMVGISASAIGRDGLDSGSTFAAPPSPPSSPSPPSPPSAPRASDVSSQLKSWARELHDWRRALASRLKTTARQVKSVAKIARDSARTFLRASTESSASMTRASEEVRTTTMLRDAERVPIAPIAPTHAAIALPDTSEVRVRALEPAQAASTRPAEAQAGAAASSTSRTQLDGQKSGNFSWSNNGRRLDVKYRGDVEFTDDDTDVRKMTPGGWLTITDGGWFRSDYSVEFRAAPDGSVTRRFWIGRNERPFDPEGHTYVAEMLPRFIRETGIGASSRVARILKSKGTGGVLAEISLIEGDWPKRVYFSELLKTQPLDSGAVQQALEQAGRQIKSDFELASLLIASEDRVTDGATRKAYLDAARTIESDFELRRTLASALKQGRMSPASLAGLLDVSTSIDSDFEEATLLIDVAKGQLIDGTARTPFFAALATIDSAFERRRVLTTLLARNDLGPEILGLGLESAATTNSDFERASVLLEFLKDHSVEGVRAPFFKAVGEIQSSFERGRVLQAVARRSDLSDDTVLSIIRAAHPMTSGFEKSQVLLALAGSHQLTREGRDAYIDAAQNLGDFEQGRVMSALVRNERRR